MSIYRDTVLADLPAGYWRLDDLSGAAVNDSSGNAHHGIYNGGVTQGQAGAIVGDNNAAALFDGTSGYAALPDDAPLNITGDVTLEAWIKTTADGAIIGGYHGTTFAGYALTVGYGTGTSGLLGYWNGTAWSAGTSPVNDGSWHHVAVVATSTSITFYKDGAVDQTLSTSGQPSSYAGLRRIGSTLEPSGFFTGLLDEVAIYPVALAPSRLLAHYNAGIAAALISPGIGSSLIRRR